MPKPNQFSHLEGALGQCCIKWEFYYFNSGTAKEDWNLFHSWPGDELKAMSWGQSRKKMSIIGCK